MKHKKKKFGFLGLLLAFVAGLVVAKKYLENEDFEEIEVDLEEEMDEEVDDQSPAM